MGKYKRKTDRPYVRRELALVTEFLEREFAKALWWTQVRLGTPPEILITEEMTPEEVRMVGLWRRWCDAVLVTDGTLYIIEAMIVPKAEKVGQLELYMRLAPHTPELREYLDGRQLKGMLLYAVPDPVILAIARERGFETRYYHPDWVDRYLEQLRPRQRRAVLQTVP